MDAPARVRRASSLRLINQPNESVGGADCERALVDEQKFAHETNAELVKREDPELYFERSPARGDPPAGLIAPMAQLAAAVQAPAFVCHGCLCRSVLAEAVDNNDPRALAERMPAPMQAALAELKAQGPIVQQLGGLEKQVDGRVLRRQAIYLRLSICEPPADAANRNLEGTCDERLPRLRAHTAHLTERLHRALSLYRRFERFVEDSELSASATQDLAALWPSELGQATANCRGGVCRVVPWKDDADEETKTRVRSILDRALLVDPRWRERFRRWDVRKEGLYVDFLGGPSTPEGKGSLEVMSALRTHMEQSLRTCTGGKNNPQAQKVILHFYVPGSGEINEDGVGGRISVRVKGPGAAGVGGQCLVTAAMAFTAATPLRKGTSRTSWDFMTAI